MSIKSLLINLTHPHRIKVFENKNFFKLLNGSVNHD